MVSQSYMLEVPPPPSATKRFIDQSAVPVLIDAAASVERQLEWASVTARKTPTVALGAAFGIGWILARFWAQRARRL